MPVRSAHRDAARPGGSAAPRGRSAPGRRSVRSGAALPLAAAALLLLAPAGAAAQEPGGGEDGGGATTTTYGEYVFAEQSGRSMLVAPDTGSTLNEGGRIFLRCSDGRREVYVASTEDRLGNAEEGAGGRYRFGNRPWSDLTRWGSNEKGSAAFMPPRFAGDFAARARDADSEVVEFEIVNTAGVRHRYVFSLDGFAEGVQQLGCFSGGDGGG